MDDLKPLIREVLAEFAEGADEPDDSPGTVMGIAVKADPVLVRLTSEIRDVLTTLMPHKPEAQDLGPLAEAIKNANAEQTKAVAKHISTLVAAISTVVGSQKVPQVNVAMDLKELVDATKGNTEAVTKMAKAMTEVAKALSAEKRFVFNDDDQPIGLKAVKAN